MVQLPEDIIKYILEFNPGHREKFKLTFDELKIKAAIIKFSILINDWNNISDDERPSFPHFIIFSNHIDDFQRYVKTLYKCNCCKRHQINKPSHFNDMEWNMEGDEYILYRGLNSECNCKCPCRHMARQCCIVALPHNEPFN